MKCLAVLSLGSVKVADAIFNCEEVADARRYRRNLRILDSSNPAQADRAAPSPPSPTTSLVADGTTIADPRRARP